MVLHRLGRIAACAIALLLVVGQTAALAAERTTITTTVDMSTGAETFTATGSILCPSGTVTTVVDHVGGDGPAASFHRTKTLVCSDGSGGFTIAVHAATNGRSPTEQGGWLVVSGTGDYEDLNGGGNAMGTYFLNGQVDVYTGVVQN
jgi:hypothetical protein